MKHYSEGKILQPTNRNKVCINSVKPADLAPHPKWLVYPYLGFGVGLTNLILYNNVNTQTSFALSIVNLNLPAAKIWTDFYIPRSKSHKGISISYLKNGGTLSSQSVAS